MLSLLAHAVVVDTNSCLMRCSAAARRSTVFSAASKVYLLIPCDCCCSGYVNIASTQPTNVIHIRAQIPGITPYSSCGVLDVMTVSTHV
jgi:hypothetical protein